MTAADHANPIREALEEQVFGSVYRKEVLAHLDALQAEAEELQVQVNGWRAIAEDADGVMFVSRAEAAEAERDRLQEEVAYLANWQQNFITERDRLAEDTRKQYDQIERMAGENKRLADALRFYADDDNWQGTAGEGTASIVDDDMGDTARAALAGTEQP